ncbi:hypothetical protein HELRODRAFT_191186 [Helobdella robusta]|uniref:Uncharacterized protein n=1 Tax=Helobdella robusta TaxID=6412 RepID=T1FSQ2_HELRO|nr:hypothetical protein HELRODRAFT_191186 [Helobdella robusta]ESO06762.1 hypothetical protein HELRODRAFT_191186 [Helobdella robusta]
MENKQKLLQADPAKDTGSPIVVDYMKNKYNQFEKDKDVSKISLPTVVREPQKLDFSWNKVVDEKKKDTSGPVLREQDILAFLMTASGSESGKSQYLNLVEAAGKNASPSSAPKSEVIENIAKDMTKNVRSMFEKGDTSNTATKTTPKRISLIEDSAETNSVFENTPTARSDDIIKSGEAASEGEQVQKGTTKNLLDQWQKKSEDKSIYVSPNKSLIKLVDDDSIKDQTSDNEKMQENDIIQKGFAKNLLNQWNNQNIEGVGADQINKDDKISSNDLEQAREKITDAEVVQKGTAKSLLDQWNDKKNQTYVAPKQTVVLLQSVTTDSSIIPKSTIGHQTAPNTDLLPKTAKSMTISDEPAKNDSDALSPEAVNQSTQESKKSEETKEEEIDLDSLQKGLAKAMVLQWKSDHPDDSLDDIIQNATKTSGSYNEILLEKGIDKTLYEQWKYVKFKHLPKLDRSKKSLVINIPEKRTRPTVMQVMANRANEEANAPTCAEKEAENLKNDTLEKILNKDEVNSKDLEKLPVKTELPQNNAATNVIKDEIPNNVEKIELNENRQKPDLNKNVVKDQLNEVKFDVKASVALSENLNTFFKSDTKDDETVKTSDISNVDTIEKGFARTALEQLRQSVESSKIVEKKTILLSPVDDKVPEYETAIPDTSSQRCEISESQPVIQQGLTKHLLGQWQNKNTETVQFSKRRIIVDEDEGLIAENEPIISTDVIKSKDDEAKNLVEKGTAKMIMNQLIEGCKNKEISKSQKIIISEIDGTVCENEPLSRNDIAKEDEQLPSALNVVQQGTTKNLLGRWNKITTDSSEVLKKEPVNLVLDSGHIIENEPVKRVDVVSSEPMQNDEIEKIEKGFTKSLLNQWQNQNVITSTAKSKTKIEIREEDGSLSENNPETLENIARETETTHEYKPVIQSGLAKSLVGQWQNKNLESFRNEKTPIVIEENDGQCAENEPITRENVVRSDQSKDETIIEKGYTKNILNQLKTMPLKSNVKSRTPITISEQDGFVAENDPIQRSDVVKSGVEVEETFVQKGFTKSILNQWHEKKDNQTKSQKTTKIEIKEEDGQCVENEPIIRSDVIKSTDNVLSDEINIGKGFTMNMLNQWQQNTNERSSGNSSRDKTPIVISHEDGKIVENIPIQRDDVAREGDANTNPIHVVQTGTAKQLKTQWQNLGNKTFEKENRTAVVISEDDGRIVENQPIERTDVVKGDQTDNDISSVECGITKSLVGHWKNKQMEEFTPEKKVIKIASEDGHVAENAPITKDDVAKESSTIENTSVVQKGTTKQLLNRWKNPDLVQKPSTKTTVQISKDDGVVAENEPIIRDDIIKADMPAKTDELEIVQKGITKSLTSQWSTSASNETNKDKKIVLELDSGHVAENDPSPKRTDVFREENQNEIAAEHMPLKGQASLIKQKLISAGQYKVQGSRKEPINIYDTNSNEKCVVENEPVKREGVAREDDENYADNFTVLRKGYAKNMAGFWTKPKSDANQNVKKQSVFELADGPAVYENDPQPSRKNEIQQVLEAGVFENNPVTREDVAREADFQPEIISAHATRNVRKLWSQKEAESTNPTVKTKKPEPVRFTPPREKSPPRQVKEEFKSTHNITFKKS